MKKSRFRYLYVVLAMSLVLSTVLAVVGFSNSMVAEAAAADPTTDLTTTPDGTLTPDLSKTANAVSVLESDSVEPSDIAQAAGTQTPADPAQTSGDAELPAADGNATVRSEGTFGSEALDESQLSGVYTIENKRFGIDSTGKNARATTDGINEALNWAIQQGYTTVKFQTGNYMIQCNWRNRYIAPTDGIMVPSGLTLDLGDSTFMMEPNSYPEYTIFAIVNQQNVTIKNGTLIGDLDDHIYAKSDSSPTHEYGFGICISASTNVLIQNVTISKMTGDGIIVEGSYTKLADGGSVSTKVRILDCDISQCRRQGISVIGMRDSEIAGNRIYDISGAAPEYGIDIESELDYIIDSLKIHDNVIYGCAGGAISCNKGNNYEVYNNICSGNILTVFSSGIKIFGNTIRDSFIEVMRSSSNITVENNILHGNSRVQIN